MLHVDRQGAKNTKLQLSDPLTALQAQSALHQTFIVSMSVSLCPSLKRSLVALGYTTDFKSDLLSETDTKKLILWLEETKIRLFSPAERSVLREISPNQNDSWVKSLGNYLKSLGILPTPVLGTIVQPFTQWSSLDFRQSILNRLISYAIQDEYLDLKEVGIIDVSDSAISTQSPNRAETFKLDQCVCDVKQLLQKLGLPLLPSKPSEFSLQKLSSAIQAIKERVAPPQCNQTHKPNLNMSLGFNVKDPRMRDFCVVLRLIHVAEIRKLQHSINETLSALQEITGDPKTDTRQGRVGR